MSLTFLDLQDEVKRRATRDQGGTQFDVATKNIINMALIRIANESPWRVLRRTDTIETDGEYTTGTVTTTKDSKTWSGSSTVWLTSANARVGRRLKITGSSAGSRKLFRIATITADTTLTTEQNYDVTGASSLAYNILGREDYTLPAQTGRVSIIWHEGFGYPFAMRFVTDRQFFDSSIDFDNADTPTIYRMWTQDWVLEQPKAASVMTISSSASGDTSIDVMVHGIVSGFPDFEKITTNSSNATTTVDGTKSFTKIDRVAKDASTTGRLTITANSTNTTVATIPTGDILAGLQYKHIQIFPPPDTTYVLNVWYYKDPARLVNDEDIHELGPDFDEVIILLATSKILAQQSKKELQNFFSLYNAELKILRRKNADKLDWLPRLQRPRSSSFGNPRLARNLTFAQVGSKFGPSSRF